jgi:ERCC4-type nuclease
MLLLYFKSVSKIKAASPALLSEIIGAKKAAILQAAFNHSEEQ